MKIDIFAHICPQKFIDAFAKQAVSWETVARTSPAMGGPALYRSPRRQWQYPQFVQYNL